MKEELIWPVCLVPPELLATASTIFRLIYRKHNQGLWWDDHFVLISLILAFICFVVPWLSLVQGHPTLHIVSGWLYKLSLPTQIWTGRISLALTVARIMPRQHPIFSLALCVVVFFWSRLLDYDHQFDSALCTGYCVGTSLPICLFPQSPPRNFCSSC